MKNKLFKDSWFQMFAAIGGVAYLVSAVGGPSASHAPTAAPAPAPAPAAAKPAAAPAAQPEAVVDAAAKASPAPAPSPDFNGSVAPRDPGAVPDPVAQPAGGGGAVPPPAQAPKMTLTGAGVGNNQGIVGAPAGGGLGGLGGLLNGLLGGAQPQQQAVMQGRPGVVPLNRVAPSRKGIYSVGPQGVAGVDTGSLRDAVFSAANGDLILVKPGTYEGPIEVVNKSLRIRGTGPNVGAVVVNWSGRGATITVRNGTLDLEKIRVEHGNANDFEKAEPSGAVYAIASVLRMDGVELDSADYGAPPLIAEQGDKPTRVTVQDSRFTGARANMVVRGPVKAKLSRVSFDSSVPLAAWIDAFIELVDCRFTGDGEAVISAYEGARVTSAGKWKPRVSSARDGDSAMIQDSFGAKKRAPVKTGFSRDIFRRGRKPGSLP